MKSMITAKQAREMQVGTRLSRYRLKQLQSDNLDAPTLEGHFPDDNLLPKDTIESVGLVVEIPKWHLVRPADIVTLYWNETNAIDSVTVGDPDKQDFPIKVTIGPDQLKSFQDGTYNLTYAVESDSGAKSYSDPTSIKIDTSRPDYDNIPEALTFPEKVVSDGITSDYLAKNDDKVIATVPGYDGIEAGQTVHSFWENQRVDVVTVTAADVENYAVKIPIKGELIRTTGDGRQDTYYYLSSRAGYDGQASLHAQVDVLLSPTPTNLAKPRVPLADDGLIDLPDAQQGVIIDIDQYDNALPGDQILAKWGNTSLGQVSVDPQAFPVEVRVSTLTVISEGSGTKAVSYQVVRSGHHFDAPILDVTVDVDTIGPPNPDPDNPINKALQPPTVKGGGSETDNELGPDDAGKDATVTVPIYDMAAAGDIVTVYWGTGAGSTTLTPYPVTAGDVTAGTIPPFAVPKEVVDKTPDSSNWPVNYTLSRSEEPHNPVYSPTQAVDVFMHGPSNLEPAVFPDANSKGWLLKENVENGCNVTIPVYENMAMGDVVSVSWTAFSTTNASPDSMILDTTYTKEITVDEAELADGVKFSVPYEPYIEKIAGASPYEEGAGQVTYTVTLSSHDFAGPTATVKIDLGSPGL